MSQESEAVGEKKKVFKKTMLSVALASSLAFLSGCHSTSWGGSGNNGVAPNGNLTGEDVDVASSSYMQSCFLGMFSGALVGLLVSDNKAQGALIGAASGCALFMGGNALLNSLRQNYSTLEDQYNALISIMQENNAKAHNLVRAAELSYNEDHQKMQTLQRQISQGQASVEEIRHNIAYLDANIETLGRNIEEHQKALASYKNASQELRRGNYAEMSPEVHSAIAQCSKRIRDLERDIDDIRLTFNNYVRDRDVLNLAYNNSLERVPSAV